MNIKTHQKIVRRLCGRPLSTDVDASRVEMETSGEMIVDDHGLVHGGFIFGLADHAAMIAVNHPNVVLGAAEVKFFKPVRAGEKVMAEARNKVRARKKSCRSPSREAKKRFLRERSPVSCSTNTSWHEGGSWPSVVTGSI
jgi:uncharacterized protein (TIGR00369 family)